MDHKVKGVVFAWIASDWRKVSSFKKTADKLRDSMAEKGYVVEDFNKGAKPARRPTRKQVLAARGVTEEETEDHGG